MEVAVIWLSQAHSQILAEDCWGFGPLTVEEDDAGAGIAHRHCGAKSRLLTEDVMSVFR